MGKYYKYVNGHTLFTKNSKEIEGQVLGEAIASIGVCKNCGLSGDDIQNQKCEYSKLQEIDKEVESTIEKIKEAEDILRASKQKRISFRRENANA